MSASHRPRLAARAASLAAVAAITSGLAIAGVAAPATAVTVRAPSAGSPAAPSHLTRANYKKGVGAWPFRGVRRALIKSGVSWYYTWAVGHPGIKTPKGVSFVPMIWGAKDVTAKNLRKVRREGHILLTFNEPDLSAPQANMTVSEALRLWPRLEATRMRLASPAVASNAATPGSWLADFMAGAAQRHYRVNFISLHWYGSYFHVNAAVSELQSYIESTWNAYHKPIWLTEFALWGFDPTRFPSPKVQAQFVRAATTMLQGLPYVWRYSWFALPSDAADGTTGLFRPGAIATRAGRAFERVP
jgi:hypothetical protein